jgi:hypothetical protein
MPTWHMPRGRRNAVSSQFAGLGADIVAVSQARGFRLAFRGAAGTGTPFSFSDAAALARDHQIGSSRSRSAPGRSVCAGRSDHGAGTSSCSP